MRLTTAQALVRFLAGQFVERDGIEHRFFAGCFGIFGHGNVAGIGQALYEQSMALRRQLGHNNGVAHALDALAHLALAKGDYGHAAETGPAPRAFSLERPVSAYRFGGARGGGG